MAALACAESQRAARNLTRTFATQLDALESALSLSGVDDGQIQSWSRWDWQGRAGGVRDVLPAAAASCDEMQPATLSQQWTARRRWMADGLPALAETSAGADAIQVSARATRAKGWGMGGGGRRGSRFAVPPTAGTVSVPRPSNLTTSHEHPFASYVLRLHTLTALPPPPSACVCVIALPLPRPRHSS
jgi:hypothetical protein